MRGEVDPQAAVFSYVSAERRVPTQHPLRSIKAYADAALQAISPELDELYGKTGRPSIAPERLLKGQLLIALYSVRSDRAFCEQLDYNLLYSWFLDMSLDEQGLDQSNFSRLRERLVQTDIARNFFAQVLRLAKAHRLLSAEHVTVDSALIESWASLKNLKKDGRPPKDGGDGTGMVDFKGERRTNQTHQSSTDPEAKLMRRGNGQPAKLCFGGHALMENRSGLCADLQITDSRTSEPKVAQALLARQLPRQPADPKTHRGDLWLAQSGRRHAKEPGDRHRPHADAGLLGGQCLQPAEDVAPGAHWHLLKTHAQRGDEHGIHHTASGRSVATGR